MIGNQRMMKAVKDWIQKNPHCWWALLLIYVIAAYILPEHIVTSDSVYASTAVALDDRIPFFAPAIVFYMAWFPLLVFTGFWLLFTDGVNFRRFMSSLAVCMTLAGVIYVLWPNGQDLRPDLSDPHGLFEIVLRWIYGVDTNTNVLPSLHVACVVGQTACVWSTRTIRRPWVRPALTVLALLVCSSTVFVKQHAVLDLAAGLALGAAAAVICFSVFRPKGHGKKEE